MCNCNDNFFKCLYQNSKIKMAIAAGNGSNIGRAKHFVSSLHKMCSAPVELEAQQLFIIECFRFSFAALSLTYILTGETRARLYNLACFADSNFSHIHRVTIG